MAARRRARAKSQTYIDTMASNMAEQMKEFWKVQIYNNISLRLKICGLKMTTNLK